MNVQSVEPGQAVLALSPKEAQFLATACYAALSNPSLVEGQPIVAWLEAAQAAFQAIAATSLALEFVPYPQIRLYHHDLSGLQD